VNEKTWIPQAENPYQAPNVVSARTEPEPSVVTLRDVDRLVAAKLEDARQEAAEAQRRACLGAWEEGHARGIQQGYEGGYQARSASLQSVVRGQLNHIVRRLRGRAGQRKTTIAAEREFMADEAKRLERAIRDLGVDP
jgi:flagellar biosynthesis/type III secretory pathway protein FliH